MITGIPKTCKMGAHIFVMTCLQLAALLFAMNHFSEAPKRWDTVSLYVGLCCKNELQQLNMAHVSVEIVSNGESIRKRMQKSLTGAPQECRQAASYSTDYANLCCSTEVFYRPLLCAPDIFTETISAYSHIYLLQCQTYLPSFPIVHTISGTYIVASYSGQCKACNTAHQPTYEMQMNSISDITKSTYKSRLKPHLICHT